MAKVLTAVSAVVGDEHAHEAVPVAEVLLPPPLPDARRQIHPLGRERTTFDASFTVRAAS